MQEKWYIFTDVSTKKRWRVGKLLKYYALLLNDRYIYISWDWSYYSDFHVDGWNGRKIKDYFTKKVKRPNFKTWNWKKENWMSEDWYSI